MDGLDLIETGLALEWLATDPDQVQTTCARLQRIAADLHPDIVQVHSPALASSGHYPCPVIAVLHSCVATWWAAVRGGAMPDDFLWRTAQVAEGLKRADAVVTPSAAFGRAVEDVYGIRPVAIHNGRQLRVPDMPPVDAVFTAGRLWDDGKNARLMDDVAARIDLPFRAAGAIRAPGGERIALRSLNLLGTLDEAGVVERLAARPIFVSAALYEPFGLSVLEAAMAGCALILSDIPTFRELWDGAAVFVDPQDAGGFVGAVEHYRSDAAARERAGDMARDRAGRYTPAAMAARMASLHDRFAERAAA